MSKYNSLWEYVQGNGSQSFKLTFEEIQNIKNLIKARYLSPMGIPTRLSAQK